MPRVAIASLAVLLQAIPPPNAERDVRVSAVRELIAYYREGPPMGRPPTAFCLAIDESSVVGEPLPDDALWKG